MELKGINLHNIREEITTDPKEKPPIVIFKKYIDEGNTTAALRIKKDNQFVDGFCEEIARWDKEQALRLIDVDQIILILGDKERALLFPMTFDVAKNKIITNENFALQFLFHLDTYYQESWVEKIVIDVVKKYFTSAEAFVNTLEKDGPVWKEEAWVATAYAEAQAVYRKGGGLLEADPYEDHPAVLGANEMRMSSVLVELMLGKADEKKLNEFGMNQENIRDFFLEVNKKVETMCKQFVESVRLDARIKEEDKKILLEAETLSGKIKPLVENVRAFIARYFAQSSHGNSEELLKINIRQIESMLSVGFTHCTEVLWCDIPLYDKLYEEFDMLRKNERYPLEVYIGRDGVFAWIGRRAQDVARRRNMGREQRKKLKENGERFEIHPKYIVYPTYFNINLSAKVRREFLEQEGVIADADPLFYDTGFVGSVPEQMMRILGFTSEDIEQRIRLLYTADGYEHRRAKLIPKSFYYEAIDSIEARPMLEKRSVGLVKDKNTGKIRHVAEPTSPEQQFYFMMIKQAISRHYYARELLSEGPSKIKNDEPSTLE